MRTQYSIVSMLVCSLVACDVPTEPEASSAQDYGDAVPEPDASPSPTATVGAGELGLKDRPEDLWVEQSFVPDEALRRLTHAEVQQMTVAQAGGDTWIEIQGRSQAGERVFAVEMAAYDEGATVYVTVEVPELGIAESFIASEQGIDGSPSDRGFIHDSTAGRIVDLALRPEGPYQRGALACAGAVGGGGAGCGGAIVGAVKCGGCLWGSLIASATCLSAAVAIYCACSEDGKDC